MLSSKRKNNCRYTESSFLYFITYYTDLGSLGKLILLELKKAANNSTPYSIELDQSLLEKLKNKNISHEFHGLYDLYGASLFLLSFKKSDLTQTVSNWKRRKNRASLFENSTIINIIPEDKAELFLALERKPTNVEYMTAALERITTALDNIISKRQKSNPDSSLVNLTITELTPEEQVELCLDLERKPTDIKHMAAVLERIIKYWVGFNIPLQSLTITNLLTLEEITKLFSELTRKPTDLEHRTAALNRIIKARKHGSDLNLSPDIRSPEEKVDEIIHRTIQFKHDTTQKKINSSAVGLNTVSMFNRQNRTHTEMYSVIEAVKPKT